MLRRLELDLYYLEHRSLWFEAKLVFFTLFNLLTSKRL
jgi:lipopolysaccharide/colanic/teichoic acid biosynthesis glycosyltransferase